MKEITVVFTATFTEVVKDPAEMEFIMKTPVEELRKLQEQSMAAGTNYDDIKVESFQVFPLEAENA